MRRPGTLNISHEDYPCIEYIIHENKINIISAFSAQCSLVIKSVTFFIRSPWQFNTLAYIYIIYSCNPAGSGQADAIGEGPGTSRDWRVQEAVCLRALCA